MAGTENGQLVRRSENGQDKIQHQHTILNYIVSARYTNLLDNNVPKRLMGQIYNRKQRGRQKKKKMINGCGMSVQTSHEAAVDDFYPVCTRMCVCLFRFER